ncbi:hypothetical protein BuS5_01006 [Desulfosarcina sp. BuS5]|uniref:hypothetical protein n=2 Tax=Desulfosarcina sp. BuS5 TaxID=933262 RepID=UPI002379CE29|nr:hypothetical protein [Desulfosarcina sp. BuS5]WDN88038.1 hypothetical protein BuS5_01006 [Desulfosarcina sp. BuS5]
MFTKHCSKRMVYYHLVCICILLATGCASQKIWTYGIEPESISPVIIDKSVAIPPFSDQRLNENNNMFAMYLIPLMPFGWQTYNTPEGAQRHMNSGIWFWKPNEDIAKAAAEELNASHIFKEAFFTFRESDAPLILKGTVKSTKYNGKLFSYGLSVFQVGASVTRRPPYRPVREDFPHTVPRFKSFLPDYQPNRRHPVWRITLQPLRHQILWTILGNGSGYVVRKSSNITSPL